MYVYAANGIDLAKVIGPEGETLAGYSYDAHHDVVTMTNALGEVTTYSYDTAGRLTGAHSPAGLTTTNIYFAAGAYTNWIQTTIDLEIHRTNSFTYTNDLVQTITDERGLVTTWTYDSLQRVTRIDYPDGTYATNSYDKLDLVRTVDRMGYTNSYGYDAVRRMTAMTNAMGRPTFYNYCACGALDSIQDAAGNLTQFFYDNAGRLIRTVYPDNYMVTNTFGSHGTLDSVSDSAGVTLSYTYNTQELVSGVANSLGQVSASVFDDEDRLVYSTDANDVTITNTYDLIGRLTSRGYPVGGVEYFAYSSGVRAMTSHTNQVSPDIDACYRAYDVAGRKTNEVYVGVATNAFSYAASAAGDLLTLTDGRNDTTTWKYDIYGRVTNKLDNLGTNLFAYSYDADNRLTNRFSAAKGNTGYKYDAMGNLTNVVYPVSPAITLKYDVLNRLTNMLDAVGTTVYGYDAAGQLLSEDGAVGPDDTVNITHPTVSLRGSLSVQAPNASAWAVSYGYDAARRLTSVTSPAGAFTYGYAAGASPLPAYQYLPGGALIIRTFDEVARVSQVELDVYPSILDFRQYTCTISRASGPRRRFWPTTL